MMSDADRNKAADILMTAEKERKQAVQLTKTWADITMGGRLCDLDRGGQSLQDRGGRETYIGHKVPG